MTHLVFIPGLGCTGALFSDQISMLSKEYTVTLGDHTQGNTMTEIANNILDQAPERFGVVGLSMGGMLAFEMMHLAPERITGVALLNTTARAELPARKEMRAEIIKTAKEHGMEGVYDETYPFWVDRSRIDDAGLRATVLKMLVDTGADVFVRQCHALLERRDWRPELASMVCPGLVVTGDGDLTTPPILAQEIADEMPNARLVCLKGCGHVSTLERPEQVSVLLQDFFKEA